MPKINVLSKQTAELIAAGEVVERPASVLKELVENSIDAGAKRITAEIANGGITLIRITDDGCGIDALDVPKAFLRHATSKIKSEADLYKIASLGFRGEALCATAAVSKIELFTHSAGEDLGTHYVIEGGEEKLNEPSGCPVGTTIVIRDIFYNTPARMKFLKKDVSEGNACMAVIERAALSHPEITFKFIREGKSVLNSAGDGSLKSAIYSILGREFSSSLISLSGKKEGIIRVEGFITKPVNCRASRAAQYTFLNGRLVQSGTVCAAVEQAFKNSAMVGKFPGFVLSITMPHELVDVNVHPAKTQVRFADEKQVFDAVYYAVKAALTLGDTRPEVRPSSANSPLNRMSADEYRQQAFKIEEKKAPAAPFKPILKSENKLFFEYSAPEVPDIKAYESQKRESAEESKVPDIKAPLKESPAEPPKTSAEVYDYIPNEEISYIGEAFGTYIVAQKGNSIFLIDKHAAHERIIFNDLKAKVNNESQPLLAAVSVRLSPLEYDAVLSNLSLFEELGFEIEDFGNSSLLIRAIPAILMDEDVSEIVTEAAASLIEKGAISVERLDRIYHTVACKAAIKAGMHNSAASLADLAKRVLKSQDVMYCPHGRPVAFEIKRRELERQFGRIQ